MPDFTSAYSDDDKAKIAFILGWLNADKSRVNADLFRKAGDINAATGSQILNGKYPSNPSEFIDRMVACIHDANERKAIKSEIPFVETSIYKFIEQICRRTHLDKDIGICIGNPGVGKTIGLRRYAQIKPNVILVEAFADITHKAFLLELCRLTGISSEGNPAVNLQAFFKRTEYSLLIDEADELPIASVKFLRRLSDIAGIGIVLIGNDELFEKLKDPLGKLGKINSRIGFFPKPIKQVKYRDCKLMTESYLGQQVSTEIAKAFYLASEGSGRLLRNLLRNTSRKAARDKQPITPALIEMVNTESMAGRDLRVQIAEPTDEELGLKRS